MLDPPVRFIPAVRKQFCEFGRNPFPFPVEFLEQSGSPRCNGAPIRFEAGHIPYLHFPIVIATGQQRGSCKFHMLAFSIRNNPRVPYIAAIRVQQCLVRSDQYPVRSLEVSGPVGIDTPAQQRLLVSHTDGLFHIITCQAQQFHVSGNSRHPGQCDRKEKCKGEEQSFPIVHTISF